MFKRQIAVCGRTASALVGLWLALWLAFPLYAQPVQPQRAELATVSPFLRTELAAADGPVSFLVILRDQPDVAALAQQGRVVAAGQDSAEARRRARGQAVYASLTAHAQKTQAALRAWLDAQGASYRPFYLVNMIEVRGDATLVEALRLRPEIDRIVANPQVAGVEQAAAPVQGWALPINLITTGTPTAETPTAAASPAVSYGLADVRVPEVWAQGFRGQGIVVAGQDTGVEWTHPALRDSYRGWNGARADHTYAWFDAWAGASTTDECAGVVGPCDDVGHGTHTMGTVTGEDAGTAFGVAPEAKWIACRNMLGGFGTPASYTTCFQFFLAPYPLGGDPFVDGHPELAPHIINNSWGCPPYEGCDAESLRAVTAAMRAAGQLVVASAGNSGPACMSIDDPIGIYGDVLTVGAYAANGSIASFSSRGPVTVDGTGLLKPDLTAPGVSVISAHRNGTLRTLSGTSMAAPHVAGAAALLWSAVPDLIGEPERTVQLLIKGAVPVLDATCRDDTTAATPNPVYGYGRLDVAAALRLAQTPWRVAVAVTDGSGAPVGDATVAWVDARTGYTLTATTAFDGIARLEPVYDGAYRLRVQTDAVEVESAPIDLAAGDTNLEGSEDAGVLRISYRAEREAPSVDSYFYYFPYFPAQRVP